MYRDVPPTRSVNPPKLLAVVTRGGKRQLVHVGTLRIGTSGFVYRDWRGPFYPVDLPANRWFQYYTQVFDTVELNNTFYRLPAATAVDRWKQDSPPGFLVVCKGSRYLTHMKRLKEPREGLKKYFDLILRLGRKLGPVLWQLPPQMNRMDLERLETFLKHLPKKVVHAFEFRHVDWYREEVSDLLDEYGAAFCEHDLVNAKPPRVTGGFRYVRFHGATGKYQGRYGKHALAPWAKSFLASEARGEKTFVFFNNDRYCHAIDDALVLLELCDREVSVPAAATMHADGLSG
jgi:uncharacterized protein YecE (DUF72 family)